MVTAAVALGSNLGDRRSFLDEACEKLSRILVEGFTVSSYIETEPAGGPQQELYLNACATGRTDLTPETLLRKLQQIEAEAGRIRSVRWGPRTLDLDLLLYGEQVIETETLCIPHPEMQHRLFVLAPLAQIGADLVHPTANQTINALLKKLKESLKETG